MWQDNGSNGNNGQCVRFIDLFCGIGGFRFAVDAVARRHQVKTECVFSCDIDTECQRAYLANFGEKPHGDITNIDANAIPDHDILLAGFPCQPFSIIGQMRGFEDTRGTLFFDIARILDAKVRPTAFHLPAAGFFISHCPIIPNPLIIQWPAKLAEQTRITPEIITSHGFRKQGVGREAKESLSKLQ